VVSSGQLGLTRCCGRRGHWLCLGGSPECVGHLRRVPGGLEGENRILEAATEPPAAGFGAWRGVRRSGASRRGTWHPDIGSRPIGAVFIRIRARSRIDLPPRQAFLVARPAAACPPHHGERSDQIEAAGATRDPRRQKGLRWAAKVTAAARRPRSGLGPQVRNLRVLFKYRHLRKKRR
jgi:hypothetical protein